jgi:hypothetical protein
MPDVILVLFVKIVVGVTAEGLAPEDQGLVDR